MFERMAKEGMTRKAMSNLGKSVLENDLKGGSGMVIEEHLVPPLPLRVPIFYPADWEVKEGVMSISFPLPH